MFEPVSSGQTPKFATDDTDFTDAENRIPLEQCTLINSRVAFFFADGSSSFLFAMRVIRG
jgi:hypothetical protein